MLDWPQLTDGAPDCPQDAIVEIAGWAAPVADGVRHDYFLLTPEPVCCLSCLPSDPGRSASSATTR